MQQAPGRASVQVNGAVEFYYQLGSDEGERWLLLALFSQLIDQPFYSELRTNQQLGYIVSSAYKRHDQLSGIRFAIQSPVAGPDTLRARSHAARRPQTAWRRGPASAGSRQSGGIPQPTSTAGRASLPTTPSAAAAPSPPEASPAALGPPSEPSEGAAAAAGGGTVELP